MSDDMKIIEMGSATANEVEASSHTPSRIQADTLFTFTSELEFLYPILKTPAFIRDIVMKILNILILTS